MSSPSERRQAEAERRLLEVVGAAGQGLMRALDGVAPDFARHMLAFSYADVYGDPTLDFRTRQAVAVSALTALGHAPSQLAVHIQGALNVGMTPREIVAVVTQVGLYAGLPAATNAALSAKRIFDERGLSAASAAGRP